MCQEGFVLPAQPGRPLAKNSSWLSHDIDAKILDRPTTGFVRASIHRATTTPIEAGVDRALRDSRDT
eukprot:scaffold378334_cov47-Prasinocladus_malaysianus.AAC.1